MSGPAERGAGIWRALHRDARVAGAAATALFVSMTLPWYTFTAAPAQGRLEDRSVNAFRVFDFTEAAVLLVAAAILALVIARAEGGTFSLPGRDGTFVFAGGAWVCLLIFIRQIDKPGGPDGTVVGVSWGIFIAFVAGLAIAAAGWRMRQHEPQPPPLLRSEEPPLQRRRDASGAAAAKRRVPEREHHRGGQEQDRDADPHRALGAREVPTEGHEDAEQHQ